MDFTESARLQARDDAPIVFEGVKAEGDLRGAALEMRVEQRFRNPGDEPCILVSANSPPSF